MRERERERAREREKGLEGRKWNSKAGDTGDTKGSSKTGDTDTDQQGRRHYPLSTRALETEQTIELRPK